MAQIAAVGVTAGGTLYNQSATITESSETVLQETIADSSTDTEVTFALDVSATSLFYISTTATVLIETNDGSSADDSFTLYANEPYLWTENNPSTFILGTDVTSLFVTNASGSAATVTVIASQDATP